MIPQRLHFVWLGATPLPRLFRHYMEGWQEHNPDLEVKLWTEQDIAGLDLQNREIIESHPNILVRADILRLELVYLLGGIYSDLDYQCLRSVEPLCQYPAFVVSLSNDGLRPFTNSVFGAESGHPLLRDMVLDAPRNIAAYPDGPIYAQSGSAWFSGHAVRHRDAVRCLPPSFLQGHAGGIHQAVDYPDTFAVHQTSN
jgi:mannosyltransferase OCH1-like enzyme